MPKGRSNSKLDKSTHRDDRAGIVQLVAEHQRGPVGLEAGVELLGDVVGAVLGGEELLVGQVGVRVGVLTHNGAHIGGGVLCKKTLCYKRCLLLVTFPARRGHQRQVGHCIFNTIILGHCFQTHQGR